jgi:hypothetical protein
MMNTDHDIKLHQLMQSQPFPNLREDVRAALLVKFNQCREYQEAHGIRFWLEFDEFVRMFSKKRLDRIARCIDLKQKEYYYWGTGNSRLVLSWRDKAAKASGVMYKDTARLLTAINSRNRFGMEKGDTHTPTAKAKMRKPRSAAAKANMCGKKSEAQKANMRAAQQARRMREANKQGGVI